MYKRKKLILIANVGHKHGYKGADEQMVGYRVSVRIFLDLRVYLICKSQLYDDWLLTDQRVISFGRSAYSFAPVKMERNL